MKDIPKKMSILSSTNLQSDSVAVPSSGVYEAETLSRRLQTYTNYKGKKTAVHLAAAGFVYTGNSDKVLCESCGISLFNWIGEEDALQEHRKYSPHCSFIRAKFNITFDSGVVRSDSHIGGGNDTTNSRFSGPKYIDYANYEERLTSFAGWPLKQPHQQPNILAESGFFYVGSADRARCFYCGLTLRDWDDDDFPPEVHQEWGKNCVFGNNLNVAQIRSKVVKQTPSSNENGRDSSDNMAASSFVKPTASVVIQATQEGSCSSNYGHNPAIQAVLEMGYSIDIINKAIEMRKSKDGSDFPNAVALLEVVLDLED